MEIGGQKVKLETTFTIKLKKPNLYLVTWEQAMPAMMAMASPKQTGAVWSDGTAPYLYLGVSKSYSKLGSDEVALGAATGISNGAANTIPAIFLSVFKTAPAPFSRLVDPKLQPDEPIDGEDCYVISGGSTATKNETYWISKKSHLIRQFSRSLEPPEGGFKAPEMTDEKLDEAIKAMGQEVTPERRDAMRNMMKSAQEMMKTAKIQGTTIERHTKIDSPNLAPTDFTFQVPAGTALKESVLGGALGAK